MLISLSIQEKTVGAHKLLLKDCSLIIHEGAKIGVVGRNGAGKTTLFNMLTGSDTDFLGTIERQKNIDIILTRQEHFGDLAATPLEYVIESLPKYAELTKIIENFTNHPSSDAAEIQKFSDAQEEYTERMYWNIAEHIVEALSRYGITVDQAFGKLSHLSGGEKRFLELVRVSYADADLILLDEPTNHMDSVGKAEFIRWLKETKHSVCLISHDRDVLDVVQEIIELKDHKLYKFSGNYTKYLAQNSATTLAAISQYEDSLKRLDKLHDQKMLARVRKLKARSDSGRDNAKTQEQRFDKEYNALKEQVSKPSFWIDQESLDTTKPEVAERYHKYKTKNIRIKPEELNEQKRELLEVADLSLGYTHPLFKNIKFSIGHGSRIQLKGRNGAGKSTLIQAIVAAVQNTPLASTCYDGFMTVNLKTRLGVYKQEVPEQYLPLTLNQGVKEMYRAEGIGITDSTLHALLGSYLFHPMQDGELLISQLSGGQKARFQLMSMLCSKPNLLILDEPTNHLDLPSIEELEKALTAFEGAIVYVSHDSFFEKALGGETVTVAASN